MPSPSTPRRHSPDVAAGLIFPYALTILAVMLLTHIVVALIPAQMLLILSSGTAVVGFLFAALVILYSKGLDRLRFGGAIIHAFTFAVVVGGNCLHLLLALMFNNGDGQAIVEEWFGPTIALGAIWGVGLIIQLLSAMSTRGFEARPATAAVRVEHPAA